LLNMTVLWMRGISIYSKTPNLTEHRRCEEMPEKALMMRRKGAS
jgi:hypothetical protein